MQGKSLSIIKMPPIVHGSGGGTVLRALDGVSLSDPTTVRLGQALNEAGNPAVLLDDTEIPLNHDLYLSGSGNTIVGAKTSTGEKFQVTGNGKFTSLAGMGRRVVVADSTGVLEIASGSGEGIYYVSKRYTGIAAAVISGITYNDISSTNSSYNDQLSSAKPGDELNSYPDPWSARNAALDAITLGSINTATIVVTGNDFWTVGSDLQDSNGDLTGNSSNHLVADIGFSVTNSTTIASLSQNGLTYFFNPVSLIYINATYPILLSYISDINDISFTSRIYGFLNIKQIYGELSGFFSQLIYVDNARSQLLFEFGELFLQQTTSCINIINTKLFSLNVNNIIIPDSIFMNIGAVVSTSRNGDGDDSIINVNANFIQKSSPSFPYPVKDDFWYLFTLDRMEQDRTKNISISVNTIVIEGVPESSLFHGRNSQGNYKNINYAIDVHNLHFTINPNQTFSDGGLIGGSIINVETYINLSINIDNVVTEAPLITNLVSSGTGTTKIVIDTDNALRLESTKTASSGFFTFAGGFSGTISPTTYIIKGFYVNQNQSSSLINVLTNSSFPVNEKMILSGIFKQAGTQSVVFIHDNGPQAPYLYLSFDDSILVNDGTINSVEAETNRDYALYFKDTHINSPVNPNLIILGEQPILESNLINYI